MVTVKDIARHLGLSAATVSRVINSRGEIAEATRKKVEDAVRELGYEPNQIARRLKTNTSGIIGVIVPDISNPFFATLVKGIEERAAVEGMQIILVNSGGNLLGERSAVSLLVRHRVSGIISATITDKLEAMNIYRLLHIHVVFVDNAPLIGPFSVVTIDNFLAAKQITQTLIDKGRRRICAISGPLVESSFLQRMDGYKAALLENDIEVDKSFIRFGDNSKKSGAHQMKAFLDSGIFPNAVFVSNNFMAYGALHAIRDIGLKVPEDIMIAAFDVFDDIGLADDLFINVVQPAKDMGKTAVKLLSEKTLQPATQNIILEHKII